MEFWTQGEAPTLEQFAAAWITADDSQRDLLTPDYAYLTDRQRGMAGAGWKATRQEKAERVLATLATIHDRDRANLTTVTRLRAFARTAEKHYGQTLVQAYISDLVTSGRYLESGLKVLRGELRAVMKFVRNEYAYRTVELSHAQALALIGRISRLLGEVDELTNEIRKG